MIGRTLYCAIFFFNDTATTEIYTLSLHDALPIFQELQTDRFPHQSVRPQGAHRDGRKAHRMRAGDDGRVGDRKSTRLNSSHGYISYAVFCLKKKRHDVPL